MSPSDNVESQVFSSLLDAARHFGFDYCAYVGISVDTQGKIGISLRDNYPEQWRRCYREQNHFLIDPLIHIAMRSDTPLLWGAELFANAAAMWRDAQTCGLRHGWSISVQGVSGYVAVLSFVRQRRPITVAEFKRLNVEARLLAELAHSRFLDTAETVEADDSPPHPPNPALSAREFEVLCLEAEGLNRGQIAALLDLAERTVRQYAENAYLKLQANNSAKAVMQAFRCGLFKV